MSVSEKENRDEYVNLRIESALMGEIRRIALEQDRTISAQVRRMLRAALQQEQDNGNV